MLMSGSYFDEIEENKDLDEVLNYQGAVRAENQRVNKVCRAVHGKSSRIMNSIFTREK